MLRTKSTFCGVATDISPAESALPRGNAQVRLLSVGALNAKENVRATKAVFFMHRDGPVTQLLSGAAPGNLPVLRACWMLMLGAGLMCVPLLAAPASGAKPARAQVTAQVKDTNPADYVGSDTCATCHADVASKFANNPHTKIALEHGKNGATCESCHGAGKGHVDGGGDITQIFDPAKATPREVDADCLSCHAGTHPNYLGSPHAKAGVSCISCHDIHDAKAEPLMKASQPALCYQCHTDVKPSFDMPFHHPVNEGSVGCSDCHDVHGTFDPRPIRTGSAPSAIQTCAGRLCTSMPRSRRKDAWPAIPRTDRRTPGC
jgi:predicted CXXCH cytochrome family protein